MAMKGPAARRLDIVLRSATGLKKVSTSPRMAAYAVAWMNPSMRVPSPMDKRHGRNPEWNATISLTLDDRTLNNNNSQVEGGGQQRLHIELLGRGLVSTTPIGFVTVDISDILLRGERGEAVRAPFHDYPVRTKSGRQQGILNFELCLQASTSETKSTFDNIMEDDDAVSTSWSSSSASPPQQYEQRPMSTATSQQQYRSTSAVSAPPPLPQYYQNRSTSAVSAPPPLPQYYQRETVSTVASARQQREMERSIRPEASSYGFALPMATTSPVSKHDEISLLHSYY